jgi:hypothetical protein
MKTFGKRLSCPTSGEILSYIDGSISHLIRHSVERHALHCDFCGAEMQFFAKFMSRETTPPVQMIEVLSRKTTARQNSAVQRARAA